MTRKEKIARIILFAFGGMLVAFSLYNLLVASIMVISPKPMDFVGLYYKYFPFLALIGLLYLMLGLFFKKIGKIKIVIHIIICITMYTWIILYAKEVTIEDEPTEDVLIKTMNYITYGILSVFIFGVHIFLGIMMVNKKHSITGTIANSQ